MDKHSASTENSQLVDALRLSTLRNYDRNRVNSFLEIALDDGSHSPIAAADGLSEELKVL